MTSTSEIKISKYITTLTKYNSKLTKLRSLCMRSDNSEYPLPHRCLIQPSTRGVFDLLESCDRNEFDVVDNNCNFGVCYTIALISTNKSITSQTS